MQQCVVLESQMLDHARSSVKTEAPHSYVEDDHPVRLRSNVGIC